MKDFNANRPLALVYCDSGASRTLAQHAADWLTELGYHVKFCDGDLQVKGENLLEQAQLLVIGGGASRPIKHRLGSKGCEKIHDFVAKGGHYLGLCAGSYLACTDIHFIGKDGAISATGLGLINATATGPIPALTPAPYDGSFRSASITTLALCNGKTGASWYNGGGTFLLHPHEKTDLAIIAAYRDDVPDLLPAALTQSCGLGKVILCAPHPETSATALARAFQAESPRDNALWLPQINTLQNRADQHCHFRDLLASSFMSNLSKHHLAPASRNKTQTPAPPAP